MSRDKSATSRIRNQFGQFAQIPEDLVTDPALSDRAIRLYALLWVYSSKKDRDAFPGRQRLADDLQVSKSTVDRGIGELVRRGAITVDERWDGVRQTTNVYTIVAPLPPRPRQGDDVIHRGRKFEAPRAANLKPSGAANLKLQEQEPEEQEIDQVPDVTTEPPVDKSAAGSAGDGPSAPATPSPRSLASLRGHAVSAPDVFASVGRFLAPTGIDDDGLLRLAAEILAVAPTRVVNPTAYVIRAIRNDNTREEWIARAWMIAADVYLDRVSESGF